MRLYQAAAARAVDTDRVGLVHDESGASRSAERRVLTERGHVAVHAEKRFRDDKHLPGATRLRQQTPECVDVIVREHDAPGGRQPDAVNEAGVIPLV